MKWMISTLLSCQLLFSNSSVSLAQSTPVTWNNPATANQPVIEGRLWQTDLELFYDRLPAKAKGMVRTDVMNLAHNSAGTYLRFSTSAKKINIRYQVTGGLQFPHMPATGVSGIDLYALDQKGNWHWVRGQYNFSDTIRYNFPTIDSTVAIQEYRLYLPLYNTVRWMEIGVPEENPLVWIEPNQEAPIVLYGTSILQGACASRAGLAWTNILGRNFSTPLINLGFSGNGRMEKEVIDLIAEHPAKLVVLDCIPNLSNSSLYPKEEIVKRYQYAINKLREKNSRLPILLTEHCCGLPGTNLDQAHRKTQEEASKIVSEIFNQLKAEKVKNIYLLSAKEIAFDMESTVDGTHPNDIGMMKYAVAYEKIIRQILRNLR
jgi:lysophospholipase L1-like esterase